MILAAFCTTVCVAADDTKTVTVSGRLVSSSGDAIKLTGTGGLIDFYSSTGGSVSFTSKQVTINHDGTFSATVTYSTASSPTPGQYYLCYRTDDKNSINVIPNSNFFYKEGATTASKSYGKSTLLDLREGDVTGLELIVDTGWTLNGTVRMHEDAYLTGISDGDLASLSFGLRGKGSSSLNLYRIALFLESGVREWSYRMILPKTQTDCVLALDHIQLYTANAIAAESNIHTGKLDVAVLQITGDAQLPDIILKPAKAIITPRFTVKDYVQTVIRAYAVTENETYESYFMSSNGYYGGTFDEPVTIPQEDTAETYQLYYQVGYDASGLLVTSKVYVAADGSLTTDASKAGDFPIRDTVHPISPMKKPPFAEGRIYIPDYNGSIFYIDVYGRTGSAYVKNSITVSEATVKTDEQGLSYVPYQLASTNSQFKNGASYYLQFYIYYEKGSPARPLWQPNVFYADEDGGLLVGWPDHYNFKVNEEKSNELDVQLLTWGDGIEEMYVQSEHGISADSGISGTYSATYEGATSLKVSFSFRTDVDLSINDTRYAAADLAGKTITLTGDTLNICYAAKANSEAYFYGFAVTGIEPVYPQSFTPESGVISVYGANGSAEEAILADLAAGNEIRVSLLGGETVSADSVLIAAVYGENGKLIGTDLAEPVFTQDLGTAVLELDPCAGAADLRLMLITPDLFAPQMQRWSF